MSVALFLCNRTMNMPGPWLEAGVRCVTVDIRPPDELHPLRYHIEGSVCDPDVHGELWAAAKRYVFVAAFPPCTDLAASGARWFKAKGLGALIGALQIVEACRTICEASGAPWMLENPVGTLATYWREPDYTFHPAHYMGYASEPERDAYTKKTCLWTGGGFVMPDRKPGEPSLGSLMWRLPPSDDRADTRSATPRGFARAVFEANKHHLARAAA